jgi:hypothetical protein
MLIATVPTQTNSLPIYLTFDISGSKIGPAAQNLPISRTDKAGSHPKLRETTRDHWQIYFHTQWPYTSQDRTWPHEFLPPIGGGPRLGPKEHVFKGQIGGISNALVHAACIRPSTHWHAQPAFACVERITNRQIMTNPARRSSIALFSSDAADKLNDIHVQLPAHL